ncbi:MAG: GGDEF domain-containing protein [Aquabacterium sp.]|jgi:diguanylate cyclase (GGDEF)-like protein|uniref:GGDEF domain-containing protein n=1 Tax=Aquabacterium sp. TaxID=1872578 RepID=UPI003BAE9482
MDVNAVLLACVLLVHGLVTLMWWMAANWLGLSRRAASHWMIAALSNGVALSLLPLQPMLSLTNHILLANVLVMLGLISMRRGLQSFLRLPHTDVSHVMLGVSVVVFNLLVCLPMGWTTLGESVSSLFIALLLWRTAYDNHKPLTHEFGRGVARAHSVLLGTAGLTFGATAVMLPVPALLGIWHLMPADTALFTFVFSHVTMSILTSFLAGYMVIMRLVSRLEHLSHHDSLTGLLNRRAIEHLLSREAQRLQRFNEHFSLLMLDIDHFKRINDRLGHAAGDAVLCAVAQTLQAHAREVDRVARFGGEEFCVLLPHTLHEGALQAAERLREAINLVSIPWNDEVISVTISTGLATADNPEETLDAIIQRADQALYQAKADGRNRVVAARFLNVA